MWSSTTSNSLDSCFFFKKFGTHLEKKLIYICIKKFHRFYTFELMIHFLAEKENKKFLNIHLDILLIYNSWGLNSVEYSKFFSWERL